MASTDARLKTTTVLIAGAGIGGLSFAWGLRKQFPGFDDFVICEKNSGLGGTWRANTYPGSASDIPIMYYTHSSTLSAEWPSTHGTQPEILAYWERFADKYDIRRKIVFDTEVISAVWDEEAEVWDVITQTQEHWRAKILVSAMGFLEVPHYGSVKGLETFKGKMWHSATWDESVELDGKRVAVIGYGASAAQIVPCITENPNTEVVQFFRTPAWFFENFRYPVDPIWQFIYKWVPGAARLNRIKHFWMAEFMYLVAFSPNKLLNDWYRRQNTAYIKKMAPERYHDKLIPTFRPGCKRLVHDHNFLQSLHRPNISLNSDGIDSVVEDGILTNTGEILQFDVIIFATGFVAAEYPLPIRGLNSRTMQDYFASKGGSTAFRGSAMPGFPNMFVIGGPNTLTGHASVIFSEECQVNYILKVIAPIIRGRLSYVDVTEAAADAWDALLQSRMKGRVFTDCVSWYRRGNTGKVHAIFPGSVVLFWWWMRKVDWRDWRRR